MNEHFQYLDALIGGCFHQDWDTGEGSTTLEEIIESFKGRVSAEGARLALTDIRSYLKQHPVDSELGRHFYSAFQPDFVEGTFGTPREFLSKVAELLAAPTEQRRVG